jgi:cytochrome c-type biogenesis protein CcmH/NrfF
MSLIPWRTPMSLPDAKAPLLLLLLALFLVPLAGAERLEAQIPEGVEGTFRPHPEAEKAISRLLSPFCPGFMLSQCPAAESLALRDSIQALALEGWNADALEAWMLSRHGEEYRAVPQRSGAGLLAWILPPLALLLGMGAVGAALRKLRGEGPEGSGAGGGEALAGGAQGQGEGGAEDSASPGSDPDDPEVEARLREAIRDLEFSEDPVY